MNDTHGASGQGWYGFDLDGTLAVYDNPFENGNVTHVRLNAKEVVAYWCSKNLGFIPEIVYQKDHLMLNLFDDRVVQVEPNTGWILGRMPPELVKYWED